MVRMRLKCNWRTVRKFGRVLSYCCLSPRQPPLNRQHTGSHGHRWHTNGNPHQICWRAPPGFHGLGMTEWEVLAGECTPRGSKPQYTQPNIYIQKTWYWTLLVLHTNLPALLQPPPTTTTTTTHRPLHDCG